MSLRPVAERWTEAALLLMEKWPQEHRDALQASIGSLGSEDEVENAGRRFWRLRRRRADRARRAQRGRFIAAFCRTVKIVIYRRGETTGIVEIGTSKKTFSSASWPAKPGLGKPRRELTDMVVDLREARILKAQR
ncbi:hypothetical protein MesoLj113b_73120 (plasmid) [Mesorhizobium sp. 113-3-3]|nr:hypothetical protein MesoLj113b_73120 [Mesorhizobium sp. 113-3-3]